jgi:hypothetical protein
VQQVWVTVAPASSTSHISTGGTQDSASFTGTVVTQSSAGAINQSTGDGVGYGVSSGTATGTVVGAAGLAELGTNGNITNGSIQGAVGLGVATATMTTGATVAATTNEAGSNGAAGQAAASTSLTYQDLNGTSGQSGASIATSNSGYALVDSVQNANYVPFNDSGTITNTYGNGGQAAGVNSVGGAGSYTATSVGVAGAGAIDLTTLNQ